MIKYIRGTYSMTLENGIVVESSSGVGFEITIPTGSPLYRNSEGDEVKVYTAMIVREDDMSLYGFNNKESLELFRLLITVSGIGAKGAMSIMGSMSVEQLKKAIAFEDVKEISKANGVGKKTAERLILELKDKIGRFGAETSGGVVLENGEGLYAPGVDGSGDGGARTEAIQALVALGYSKAEAFAAIAKVPEEGLTSEEYIKKALKDLF